jgi:hypothetical protein
VAISNARMACGLLQFVTTSHRCSQPGNKDGPTEPHPLAAFSAMSLTAEESSGALPWPCWYHQIAWYRQIAKYIAILATGVRRRGFRRRRGVPRGNVERIEAFEPQLFGTPCSGALLLFSTKADVPPTAKRAISRWRGFC